MNVVVIVRLNVLSYVLWHYSSFERDPSGIEDSLGDWNEVLPGCGQPFGEAPFSGDLGHRMN